MPFEYTRWHARHDLGLCNQSSCPSSYQNTGVGSPHRIQRGDRLPLASLALGLALLLLLVKHEMSNKLLMAVEYLRLSC